MKNTKPAHSGIRITIRSIPVVLLFMLVFVSGFSLQANKNIPAVNTCQPEKEVILYIVNGEEWTAKEVDELDPEKIEQIEYISEKEKIRLYTDKDVDRVVIIRLKKQEEPREQKQ